MLLTDVIFGNGTIVNVALFTVLVLVVLVRFIDKGQV